MRLKIRTWVRDAIGNQRIATDIRVTGCEQRRVELPSGGSATALRITGEPLARLEQMVFGIQIFPLLTASGDSVCWGTTRWTRIEPGDELWWCLYIISVGGVLTLAGHMEFTGHYMDPSVAFDVPETISRLGES